MIRDFLADFPKTLDDMERLLNRNRIFIDRTKGIGVLTKDEAINRSCTRPDRPGQRRDPRPAQGRAVPGLHATSTSRSAAPTAGDCFARYLVRMAEMRESLKIIEQAIENLPAGPVNVGDRRADDPARQAAGLLDDRRADLALRAGDDQPRLHGAVRGGLLRPPRRPTASWASTSSATARDVAYRARCRPPSFIHFALFPHLIRGHTLSDVVAVLGSLNIIAAELDR